MALLFTGLESIGLLILRIALFFIFIYHGSQKLFGKQTPRGFRFLGFVEFVSAIAVLLGFWTEIAGIIFAIVMLGAIYLKITKWKVSFASQKTTGWEFDMLIFASALTLAFLGAGSISLDTMFGFWP